MNRVFSLIDCQGAARWRCSERFELLRLPMLLLACSGPDARPWWRLPPLPLISPRHFREVLGPDIRVGLIRILWGKETWTLEYDLAV